MALKYSCVQMLLLAALTASPSLAAEAQLAAPAAKSTPAPVGSEPQDTTATYGDWVLHCARNEAAPASPRVCEARQTLQIKGQGIVAEIAVSRPSPKAAWAMTILLPTNIALPGVVRVAVDEKDENPADIQWRRCLPGGCVAEGEVREDTLRSWRAQSASGQIRYAVGSGQPLVLAFSFRGLAVALDNLAKASQTQ